MFKKKTIFSEEKWYFPGKSFETYEMVTNSIFFFLPWVSWHFCMGFQKIGSKSQTLKVDCLHTNCRPTVDFLVDLSEFSRAYSGPTGSFYQKRAGTDLSFFMNPQEPSSNKSEMIIVLNSSGSQLAFTQIFRSSSILPIHKFKILSAAQTGANGPWPAPRSPTGAMQHWQAAGTASGTATECC